MPIELPQGDEPPRPTGDDGAGMPGDGSAEPEPEPVLEPEPELAPEPVLEPVLAPGWVPEAPDPS